MVDAYLETDSDVDRFIDTLRSQLKAVIADGDRIEIR
jgi:hypothetical protein